MTVLHAMDPATAKPNTIENSIASGWMSGSFTGGFDQNTNLSNNKSSNSRTSSRSSQGGRETKHANAVTNILRRTTDVAKNAIVTGNYAARINPFNKDFNASDDEDDCMSRSNASEFTSTTSESGDVSLAELGLTEDYFAHPEGLFGLSSTEELEAAIENCKKMILELPENSERRKKYVKKLVELRMKHQELKEGPEEIEPKIKQVLGHKLRKRNSSSMKYYCDCCNNLIWGMLQVWYRCRECGFNCHSKCVNLIRRECVAVGIKNITYSLNISPEIGLSAQQFHCAECKNFICIGGVGKEEARLCDYTGQYFCPNCHWNDTLVVPSRVMHNWDFSPQKVSRRSHQLLQRMSRRPLLNVQEINPMLFNYVEELADIRKLREDILLMKAYFTTCTKALEMKLLLKLEHHQHFVDNSDMYSMSDLIRAQTGGLTIHLTDIHASFAQHIKLDCMYCQAKGFICEICNSGESLFPFDFGVATCGKCKAVFHRDCFTCIDTLCPRCVRMQKKKMQKIAPDSLSEESEPESAYLHDEAVEMEAYVKKHVPDGTAGLEMRTDTIPDASASPHQFSLPSDNSENSPSKAIKSENVRKVHDLNSLHMLLTDCSYTDYAMLGFAGAGKGRKSSMPFSSQPGLTTRNYSPSPHIYGNNGHLVGSSYESTPPESYASYKNGQNFPSQFPARPLAENSLETPSDGAKASRSISDVVAIPVRNGKQRSLEGRRNGGSRKASKDYSAPKSTKSRKRVSPKLERKSSLANFIEGSGMSADVQLRANGANEIGKRDGRGSEKQSGTKQGSRKVNPKNKPQSSYDNKFNPFAKADNFSSGSEPNPFQNKDAGNPFLSQSEGRTVASTSNGNPFGNDDYDDEKNPFS